MSTTEDPLTPMDANPTSTPPTTPGAFPQTSGANGVNGAKETEEAITPQAPTVDAEACKAAGNKFFKNKKYDQAIAEYTKGVLQQTP